MPLEPFQDYSPFAWFYNRHWAAEYHRQALPVIDMLLLRRLPRRSRILDLCCGTGQFTACLAGRDFDVIGMDSSREMLRFARQNAPGVNFIAADARRFALCRPFDAVLSIFDSLNHIMTLEDLAQVFRNVRDVLRPGGVFVFDLNRREAFELFWSQTHAIVEDDNICITRGSYSSRERTARCDITMLRLLDGWRRADAVIYQKCHPIEDVRCELGRAGFGETQIYDAHQELGMPEEMGWARTFFVAS